MNNVFKTSSIFFCLTLLTACGITENTNQNVNPSETSTGATINDNTNLIINTNLNVNINVNTNTPSVPMQSEYLKNLSLIAEQPIETPLVITGEAKGWYFEGSFPIEIQDANGRTLATVPAQAKGEWMTDNFVPFSATISFPKPATETGKVILRKDNPSGLPEYDMSYSIPVRFAPGA